jgi:hypothetical protein
MTQESAPAPASAAWAAIEASAKAIQTGKGDLNGLGKLIGGLFSLGLGGLVEPVLQTVNISGGNWELQRQAIGAEARKLSSGRLSWGSRSEVFANNLAALTADNPSLAGLAETWRQQADQYELYRASDGNYQVVGRKAGHFFAGCLGGLLDHRALVAHWTYRCKDLEVVRPLVFDGAGYGWLMIQVLETTHRTFLNYSCAVYVVEPDPASLCILLHLHDLRPWKNRLRFFGGPEAKGQFDQALAENAHWMLPAATLSERLKARPQLGIAESVAVAAESRKQRDALLRAEIASYYDEKTVNDWSARFDAAIGGGKPLKVMGITTRYSTVLQYSMEELGEAVRAAGHEFILAKEADDQTMERPELPLLAEHKPDLLVLISRLRHENSLLPKNVPSLCWDQDNLPCMRTPEATASLDALTYVAGHGAEFGYTHLGWTARNCLFCHPAAATRRYGGTPIGHGQAYEQDVSFISNAAESPEQLRDSTLAGIGSLAEAFAKLAPKVIDGAMRDGVAWTTRMLWPLIDAVLGTNRDQAIRNELLMALSRLADRCFRHAALHWVKDFCDRRGYTFRLFGAGWEKHPVLASHARGAVKPGDGVARVYRGTRINLQLMGAMSFIHSRSLDGLAAGGFFLNRGNRRETDMANERAAFELAMMKPDRLYATAQEMDRCTEEQMRLRWEKIKNLWSDTGGPEAALRAMAFYRHCPQQELIWPQLDQITFFDAEGFENLAQTYLEDESLRLRVMGKMQEVVRRQFSYDARWAYFAGAIRDGLRESSGAGLSEKVAVSDNRM